MVTASQPCSSSTQEIKQAGIEAGLSLKDLATTYSRGSYTATTIGNVEFDGRVRDGIGSDHHFIVTKKLIKNVLFPENYI